MRWAGQGSNQSTRGVWRLALDVLAIVLVMLGLALAMPAISDTETDEGFLARTLQDLLSDAGREVRIRGFEGALSSQATIEELSISDDLGEWIVLQDVVLDWNRAALLNRQVEVNELSARFINLHRIPQAEPGPNLPSATAREPFRLPELPVSVRIDLIEAQTVRLGAEVLGTPAEFWAEGALNLAGGQGQARIAAERSDGTLGDFHIVADFDNVTRLLNLDISLVEGPAGIAGTLLSIPDRPALSLNAHGSGPIATFRADVELAVNGVEQISGSLSLVDETPETGVLDGGGFNVDLSGDLRPLLVTDLHPFFGANSALIATGQRLETGEISLRELSIATGALNLQGRADLSATGFPRFVDLSAVLADPNGAPVLLPGSGGNLRLTQANLAIAHDASRSRDWTLRAELDGLELPEAQVGHAVLDARGRLNALSETTQADDQLPVFEGVFEFLAEGISADDPGLAQALGSEMFGLTSLAWPGAGHPIELTGMALEADAMSLTASGEINGANFDGFIEFAAPDLTTLSGLAGRDLSGEAFAELQGQINPLTGAFDLNANMVTRDLTLGIAEADSLLAGEARIESQIERSVEGTQLNAFELTAGTIDLTASGALDGEAGELTARLNARDLSRLGPGYGGRIVLDAVVSGVAGQQRLRFDGSAIDLVLGDLPAADLLSGVFAGATRLRGDVLRNGDAFEVSSITLQGPQIDLAAAGRWAAQDPDLNVQLNRFSLAALGDGARGAVAGEAHVRGETGGVAYGLTLSGDGPLRSGIRALDGVIADGLSLRLDALRDVASDGVNIREAQLAATGLTMRAQGGVQADGGARYELTGSLDSLGRVVPGLLGAAQINATLQQRAGAESYRLDGGLSGPNGAQVRVAGQVNADRTLALDLSGQLQAAMLNPLFEPSTIQGMIRFTGAVNGPAAISSLRLDAQTSGARYVLPIANIAFEGINAQAQVRGQSAQVLVEGRSLAGGQGRLEGRIALDGQRMADLRVGVTDYTVRQAGLFEANVTGDVRISGALARNAMVSGQVTVNRAEIQIPNSPLARQGRAISGLRHVGESGASRATRAHAGIARGTTHGRRPVPLRLDLTLNAPRRIFVRGRGLDAELGGQLHLGGTTRQVVPSGSFGLIRGRLDLLGNRFTLTDGSASMIGSFMPYVSLTATTESGGVSTSVTLSGQADAPEITFSSVPELPEDEVLARLIFGRSLTSLSPFQAAQLALSVATLTGRAENSILDRTREALSLDDLDLTTDQDGNTALRAGRYVSERVYTNVSVDSEGRGEVSINLDLSSNLTVRGRTDTEGRSGVGLFFERDY